MKPENKWIDDWRIDENPSREHEIAVALLEIFMGFWDSRKLDEKSKSTKQRYANGLHALGGFLVENAVLSEKDFARTAEELLFEYLDPYEGPLVFLDNEAWQEELDMVCRKLYKYIKK